MTRRGAVPKSSATKDLRARRYWRRKARMFRTWTFSAGGVFASLTRSGRAEPQVLVRGRFTRSSVPDWYMTRVGAVSNPRGRADLRARRYRRRKARMFRTWTFSGGADFARLMRKRRKSLPRADLRARRYRGRKARKFRTWTFSAGALFAREMRECRRGNCYVEVAKHASSAREVFPETGISRPGCVPGPGLGCGAGGHMVFPTTAGGLGCLPGGSRVS